MGAAVPTFRLILFLCLLPAIAVADPARWRSEWPQTDFSMTSVTDWSEIRSGGPGKDGIPALDAPKFQSAAQSGDLAGTEPVITLELEGAVPRAYPVRYLIWHEIVNDTVAGLPVAITFCPLCNSALTFDRRTPAGVLRFGVTGKLRHSDMVMYDRETQSWWQQAEGRAIVGTLTGTTLRALPTWMESWAAFRERHPKGLVMVEPAFNRSYGRNPYRGYDTAAKPFLYDGAPPPHGIAPLARVVRVGDRAWPLTRLARLGELREAGLVLSWRAGQASALDTANIAQGRDVGSIRVRDASGRDVPHDVMFAFAFDAFWPEGTWMIGR
ncbi:DUF3179 domain-containing protein [Sulfitobacter sabulilitoris]|uniref:DUF3179 domain-containing protein n=1 Tax=Sulfitobacter sabulilitoris TaxID=2562655 RepID=A0A5S3PJ13_9RHOB|nr:DUF3179 domain-containing protein [Sulfitobacter sabulilitoris]TMM54327.1 DUF3179 domain-containing protein [Sulfitobacter sabulilitoris]